MNEKIIFDRIIFYFCFVCCGFVILFKYNIEKLDFKSA